MQYPDTFRESEVEAHTEFESHFMSDFIRGKVVRGYYNGQLTLDDIKIDYVEPATLSPIVFSNEAQAVMDAGRELWKYYHKLKPKGYDVNASYYDIRLYFQGKDESGRMKTTSTDERYNELIIILRDTLKDLGKKIEPKVYEYGFLVK